MLSRSLKEKCVALRVDGRHSLREIHRKTGVSRGSLSALLRPYYSLTEEELHARRLARVPHRGRYKDPGEPSALYRLAPKQLSSTTKARVAEAAVTLRLALLGFRVFRSVFEGDRVDCIVLVGQSTVKIQVKWARAPKNGGLPCVRLCCSNGRGKFRRYQEGDFDFLVGYDLYSDTAFVWSWADLRDYETVVTISAEAAERWGKIAVHRKPPPAPVFRQCRRCGRPFDVERDSISQNFCSVRCANDRSLVVWPDNDELRAIVWRMPAIKLAEQLGVSPTAVKKRCEARGIPTPERGYWTKQRKNGPVRQG